MRFGRTQFSASVILSVALLLATSAAAQVLVITGGGRRVIDRDPDSAAANCLGWTYGASPAVDERGELVGMYTASDVLTQHCRVGASIDSVDRFGDAIQFHPLQSDGAWSEGFDVIDRASLPWMSDAAFLDANPQAYVGHVTSPSVVQRDGRWFMAFAASLDDRNLCAGEHYAGNACGSCLDPWSYFVVVWAVSDDGVHWRVRQRAPGDPTLLGRPPTAGDRSATSTFKGLTRVSLIANGGYFYIAAQYWAQSSIRVALFRVPYDAADAWGLGGEPEAFSTRRGGWVGVEDYLDSTFEPTLFGYPAALGSIVRSGDRFIAFNPESNHIVYQTSTNLTGWTPALVLRSAIPYFADGTAYDASVIDPVAVNGADGKLHLFFASADGDADHGIVRDGRHDCGLYEQFGPTAVYLGTGIYEAVVEPRTLRPTATTLASGGGGRFTVRVNAPSGVVVIGEAGGASAVVSLVNGAASAELSLTPGDHTIYAWFEAQGEWDASRSAAVIERVPVPQRRRAAR